jgi:hypothetical protein
MLQLIATLAEGLEGGKLAGKHQGASGEGGGADKEREGDRVSTGLKHIYSN